jgi:hypothetical protein
MFTEMGIDGFGDRARRELLATGEKVRKRAVEARDALTPQEEPVARLASHGLSNPGPSSRSIDSIGATGRRLPELSRGAHSGFGRE